MTHDEMIAIIQAHKEGKTIQYRRPDKTWEDSVSASVGDKYPTFNFANVIYRVKPDPQVRYAVLDINGHGWMLSGRTLWLLRATAEEAFNEANKIGSNGPYRVVKFVEQL